MTAGELWEVIVVGAGNAALTAALAARQEGARVLVMEKAPKELRGGNTRFSGGLFRFAYRGLEDVAHLLPHMEEKQLQALDVGTYTEEHYYHDIMRITHEEADPRLARVVISESLATMEWLTACGVEWELTSLFNATVGGRKIFSPGSVLQAKGKGIGLSDRLFRAAEGHDISIMYDTKFVKPLVDSRGAISGALVRGSDQVYEVSCGALVLACGGFEANSELRARYLGGDWDRAKVRGTKYNTGEGLMAALEMGAKPSGHWRGCHGTPIDASAPAVGDLKLTDLTNRLSYPYGIMVNRLGRRFVDEGEALAQYTYAKMGASILAQPGSVAYQIFDQKTVTLLEKRYQTGTPVVADSLEELALRLGLGQGTLSKTVQEFNAAVQDGAFNPAVEDGKGTRDLEPPKANWAQRLDSPPYVAYAVTGGITFTFGGLEIDTQGQVLDTEDRPIPGLYASGELTGKFFYHNYPGGAGLMRGAVFGRIAGTSAAHYARLAQGR
ncbi:MAG: FAD-dependent tricarballylate dehydrogenase TcuA [Chloroflexi bacterium]|nr:FAD-dependent tricarballylate dehydrogenase TcuA [Chloroflexota bacterium]